MTLQVDFYDDETLTKNVGEKALLKADNIPDEILRK